MNNKQICSRTGDIISINSDNEITIQSTIPRSEIEWGLVQYKEEKREIRTEPKKFKWFK